MKRTTGFAVSLFLAAALLPWPASAAEEDVQFWNYTGFSLPLGGDLSGSFEASPRFREGDDALQLRAGVDYKLSPRITLGGALVWVESGGPREIRPQQQVTVSAGPLAFRTRLEQRFFDGADRVEWRLRQRVQATVPVREGTDLVASGEWLYILQPRDSDGEEGTDNLRGIVGLRQDLTPELELGINYLLLYSPESDGPDEISHVPQLTLTWRP